MRLLILFIIFVLGSNSLLFAAKNLRFGVLSYSSKDYVQQQYQPVVDYLNAHLRESKVELIILGYEEFDKAVQENRLDMLTTNPSHYEIIHNNNISIRTIATTEKIQNDILTESFGGVIFTQASNKALNTIKDLKKASIAAMDINSLGAYQSQVFEALEHGIDVRENITVMKSQIEIIRSVMQGKYEAGFVRTGMIESELAKGRLKKDDIKLINSQQLLNYPYLLSTRLYPEWPVAVLPNMDEKSIHELLRILLEFHPDQDRNSSIYGFSLPHNYAPVEHTARMLGLPPYDMNIEHILLQYSTEILVFLFLILIIIIVILRLLSIQAKLRFNEERFKLAMDGTQDGLFDWDMLNDTMFHSEHFETMLGYSGSELPQTVDAWKALLHPDDKESAYDKVQAYLQSKGEITYLNVFRMKSKDGNWRWIEGRGKALFDSKGEAIRFIGFNTDITEKKEQEKQLLIQTKHAQMGEMIAMIAHQWRQPLSAITATVGTLQMKIGMDKYEKVFFNEQLEKLNGFSQHLSETIEDFRNFFKVNKQKEMFSPKKMIESSLNLTEGLFKKENIIVETDLDSRVMVSSFENELMQVVVNILKNAYDALVENNVREPKIIIKVSEEADEKVRISIEDNAGGISDDIIDKIFEPYFSTKSMNGTGLGLYMSKSIIQEHCKGVLTCHNTVDGACFTITLDKDNDEVETF